jgi:3-phytase
VQGRSRFAVYDRKAPHAFRGLFRVGGGGVDGVSGTDGVAATSQPLGDAYPRGLLVVQDDRNTAPAATQDFKFVSWADVAAALGLGD